MSKWIRHKDVPEHLCEPPSEGVADVQCGDVWRCDCGAFYTVVHLFWRVGGEVDFESSPGADLQQPDPWNG